MVIFNECRIDKEGKNLIVDVSVDSLSFYKNIYLESITIDTEETFIEHGPSNNYIYKKKFVTSNGLIQNYSGVIKDDIFIVDTQESTGPKNIRLKLSYKELGLDNLDDNILFVYIGVGGVPESITPCGMDNKYSVAVAVNMRPVYNMSMSYLKELDGTCTTPKGFIDMILRVKAFELSLKTGNFITAIKQWDKLFKNKKVVSLTKECSCNGVYT